uniref:ATP synthase F0 subunit 8 n=1 Tax=Myra affinis TaxID=2800677 RepID=UPI001FAF16A5|nr:ATP synthase F0 subunit 8 [Myra affinis]UJP67362.1 ATP synthase F0 subunit 8 [Myra affinis]
MPQMAPLLWLYLFLFFLSIFLIFSIMNYFNKPCTPKLSSPLKFPFFFKLWKL